MGNEPIGHGDIISKSNQIYLSGDINSRECAKQTAIYNMLDHLAEYIVDSGKFVIDISVSDEPSTFDSSYRLAVCAARVTQCEYQRMVFPVYDPAPVMRATARASVFRKAINWLRSLADEIEYEEC